MYQWAVKAKVAVPFEVVLAKAGASFWLRSSLLDAFQFSAHRTAVRGTDKPHSGSPLIRGGAATSGKHTLLLRT